MPTAKKDAAPKTATVSETIIRKETRDPVEVQVTEPAVPISPRVDFWKYIKSLSDEDWKTHHVTLYRYPLGQPKPDKLGRYIKTYKHGNPLLSEEQIYEEFGGSQYTAMLKGPGRSGEPWTLIATQNWEMDGPAKNPWQTSPGGTVPTNGNELAATLQVLLPQLRTALTQSADPDSPAIKASIGLIQQLTAAMPKPQGIGELVSGLADLKKLTGETDSRGSTIRETLTVLKEFGIIGGERRSIAQEVKEILEISAMMSGGGGGGGRKDWPTALVENLPGILEKVTPIADKFADAARSSARVAEIRAGGRPGPITTTTTTVPAALPAPQPAAARVPAAESPAPRAVATPETEPAGEPVRPPNLLWAKAKAVQLFQRGMAGDEVAEFLDRLDEQLGAFLGSMDETKFRAFVEGDAILRTIVPAPRYGSFVKDFVAYFSEELEPGDEGAPSATPE